MSDSSVPSDEELQDWSAENVKINEVPVTDIFLGGVDDSSLNREGFEIEDLPPADITEGMPAEEPVKIGDGECVVCGAPTFRPPGLTKAGRKKRTPKYCDLHDPKLRISKDRPLAQGVEGVALKRVQDELADDLRLLAVMAGPLLPVTGVYVFENADPFVVAVLKMCKNNPRALRVLHRAATVAPIYEVAKDCAGVFYAIQVDMHRLDPQTTVSQRLGVREAYLKVYPEDQTNIEANGSAPGPPRYAAT